MAAVRELVEQAIAKLMEECPDVWQRKVAADHLRQALAWAELAAKR